MYKDRERKNAKQRELRQRYKHDPKYIAANKAQCHRYYLKQKREHPVEMKTYRDKARALHLARIKIIRQKFMDLVCPERECQVCGGAGHLNLHHKFYKENEKEIIRRGGYLTLRGLKYILDDPSRFRVLCYKCHNGVTLLASLTEEQRLKLIAIVKEDQLLKEVITL